MAFTKTWDETKPAGTRDLSLGDDDIREFKFAIRERLAVDHSFLADETGDSTIGYHTKCTFKVQASDPTAIADTGILYTKDVSAKAELHYIDEDSNVVQITEAGGLSSGTLKLSTAAPATPTANLLYKDSIVKGWVHFDGSDAGPITPKNDVNVSSVSDGGTGKYTINWATSFADGNYAVVGMCEHIGSGAGLHPVVQLVDDGAPAAASVEIHTVDDGGVHHDYTEVMAIAIGDQ